MRLSHDKLDKLIKSYFDLRFKDSRLVKINTGEYRGWYGFVIGDEDRFDGYQLILGTTNQEDYKHQTWYHDGNYFKGGKEIFGLEYDEFNRAMKRYISQRYPELQIADLV